MKRACASVPAFGLLLALLAGCGPEAGAGSVRVFWVVAGSSCGEAGVASVRIHVEDGEGNTVVARPVTQSCSNGTEGAVVRDVPEGSWTVRVEGLDVEANAFLEGSRSGVAVESGRETAVTPAIQLSLIPSRVRLKWKFANGHLCNSNGVSTVEVNVIKGIEGTIVSKTWPCDPEPVDDEGGVILAGLPSHADLTFNLFGLTTSGVRKFKGAIKINSVPGETQSLELDLISCSEWEGGCI
jgi:hypothetical protein